MCCEAIMKEIIRKSALEIRNLAERIHTGDCKERAGACLELRDVANNLDIVLNGSNVPWNIYKRGRELLTEILYLTDLARRYEIHDKLSSLKAALKSETTDNGWQAYLRIETLISDMISSAEPCRTTTRGGARRCSNCLCVCQ